MILEVRGTNTRNKGAELMLRAAVEALRDEHQLAVEPRIGSYDERSRLGLLQKATTRAPDQAVRLAQRVLPSRIDGWLSDRYGIVLPHRIDAVLDAAGFAYSDQFDLERSLAAAALAEQLSAAGRPYVLLPQAFGPFEGADHRAAFRRLLDASALVFARDRTSLEHVRTSGGRQDHVRLAPDFTCLLKGRVPEGFAVRKGVALLVPSSKLLTETSPEVADAYLPFFVEVAGLLRERGSEVALLVHERGDEDVVQRLRALLPETTEVLRSEDARDLKGMIGTAHLVVGSRFHALVSALTQGVPSLGIGWSHKYDELFGDYGCSDMVLDPVRDREVVPALLERALETESREVLVRSLVAAADEQRKRSRAMWAEVRRVLAK